MELKKFDDELQIVYGEVYAPGVIDAHGDYMTADDIRKMAHSFLENMRVTNIDTNHDHNLVDAVVVESYIAQEGDPTFIPGSWVAGVHVKDEELWQKLKSGEYNGFSFDGTGYRKEVEVEVEIPDKVSGSTDVVNGHRHKFIVQFDESGEFIGGRTDVIEGHYHEIVRGTVTETVGGHKHKFSYVEELLNVQEV